MSKSPESTPFTSQAATREAISPETAHQIKTLLDAVLDDPHSISLDTALLRDTNPNPEAGKPTIDPSTGETYEERYAVDKGVYLQVQRTVRHDETRLGNPLATTHHLMVEPDRTSLSEVWLHDGKVMQSASVDYINPTDGMRETSQRTLEATLVALQLAIEELSSS